MRKKSINWLNQYKLIRQHITDSLWNSRMYSNGRMLDVGCGTKPYKYIFDDVVENYIGTDYPSNISANKEHKNVEVYSIIPYVPFKDMSFDTVVMTEVLEHVSEPSDVFKEIYRIMNSGGHLILTTPQSWGLHEEPNDFYRYTKYGLKYLAEKNGFIVVDIRPFGGLFLLIGQRLSGFVFYKIPLGSPICAVIQLIFSGLDKLFYLPNDTLGNMMVARKL